MPKPSLVIMAGGTGGHVFPGLAVAHFLTNEGWQIYWVGTRDKMEADLVPKHGFPIHFIDIGGMRGKSILTKLLTPFKLLGALIQSIQLLRRIKPQAVLGMGGYASGPGGIAARLLNIPLVIHEQNAVFGLTNRYLAKVAQKILTGFDLQTHKNAKKSLPANTEYVGNPIRDGFFTIPEKELNVNTIHILIVGGSLGALALNQIVPTVLAKLAAKVSIHVHHQSGKNKHQQVLEAYANMPNVEVTEFIDNIEASFAWADIIICRAGALTVAEVAGAGRVAIFVPLPIAVDDHQTANAMYLSENGAAIVIAQAKLEKSLYEHVYKLSTDSNTRNEMAKKAKQSAQAQATENVANAIYEVSGVPKNNMQAKVEEQTNSTPAMPSNDKRQEHANV